MSFVVRIIGSKYFIMDNFLIILAFLLGTCIPISRLVLNNIKRSEKYTDAYKKKAEVFQNIFNISCIIGAIIIIIILKNL